MIAEQQHIAEMSDAEFGRWSRTEAAKQYEYAQAARAGAKAAHRQWIGRVLAPLPPNMQQELLGREWPDEDEFFRTALKRGGKLMTDSDLTAEIDQLKKQSAEKIAAIEMRLKAGNKIGQPSQRLIEGQPSGSARPSVPRTLAELEALSPAEYERIRPLMGLK